MLSKDGIEKYIDKYIHVSNSEEKKGSNYIYVTLGDTLKVYDSFILDVRKQNNTRSITIPESGLLLEPNKLYLGTTNEYTKTYGFVPYLSGLEELATRGIEIHITAGYGDNGFEGTWVLEIICTNPTIVYPNMLIGRLYYHPLIGNSSIEYKGKYLGQTEPVESRINLEYTKQMKMGMNYVDK